MLQPPRAILRWDTQLDIWRTIFLYNGSVARTQLDIGMLFVVIGTSTYSPNTCYQIEYKIKNCKISKIPRNLIVYPPEDGPWGPKHVVNEKGK
jgi:hypothetical protein